MNRKAISAYLIGCEPEKLMAYADRGDHVGVIGPDGKKYIFTIEKLESQDKKMNPPKPNPKPKAKATTQSTRKSAAKRKPLKRKTREIDK